MFRTSFHCPLLLKVNAVEANQRKKSFYPLSSPSMDDDATIIFSSSRETTKTSKIRLPVLPPPLCWSTSLHSNQPHHLPHHSCSLWRPSTTYPLVSHHFLHIISIFLPSSTSMLMWTTKMESFYNHHYIDLRHLCHVPVIKRNMGIS